MAALPDWKDALREMTPARSFCIENILVPLDGSETAKLALPVARVLARIGGATLHVLYIGNRRLRGPRETLEQLGLTSGDLRGVVIDQVKGEPGAAIQEMERRFAASLIVLCTHTGAYRQGASVGSITRGVLSRGPNRVVLVPANLPRTQWQLRRVVLAHDGSPSADLAIGPTADLAHRASAEVTALHVAARGSRGPSEPGSIPAPRYVDQPHHEWPAWANEFVERMMTLGHSPGAVNFKLLVTGGQPGSEVAQFARDHGADLVVVPWHGQWVSQRLTTCKVVVRRSGCPVLLINAQQPNPCEPIPEG